MIGKKVQLSKESEKQIVIQELNSLGIFENIRGERLERLNHHALIHLLAVEKAIRK